METPLKEIKISLPSDILLSANINQEEIVQEMLETQVIQGLTPLTLCF